MRNPTELTVAVKYPQIIKTLGLTPEQEALLTSGRVRVTLHSNDAKTPPPQLPARSKPLTPEQLAWKPVSVEASAKDFSAMSTTALWAHHAKISEDEGGASATAFFRAQIKPCMENREPVPVDDHADKTTAQLWEMHGKIEDGAARTSFFRAFIKPRMTF